jgi:hypothetical protein
MQEVVGVGVAERAGQEGDKKPRPNHVLFGSKGGPGGSGGKGGMVLGASLVTRTFPDISGHGVWWHAAAAVVVDWGARGTGTDGCGCERRGGPMVVPPVRTRWRNSRAAWADADRAATIILRSVREFVR